MGYFWGVRMSCVASKFFLLVVECNIFLLVLESVWVFLVGDCVGFWGGLCFYLFVRQKVVKKSFLVINCNCYLFMYL